MSNFSVEFRNVESNMLHSVVTVVAADAEHAVEAALDEVKELSGYNAKANNASVPAFRTAVRELESVIKAV